MMGCSGRKKFADIRPEQKWDFISLNDFKSSSALTVLAYGYLYVSLGISIAVYGVDTFTAVNLLAFNKWTSQISPAIPVKISRWIFSVCIILSWINLGYEWVRAVRVMRRGAVAESYLDPLAVRLQSIRPGSGNGWKRFLVFAELTKSKKGAEYIALFAYFSFKAWIRVIFCSGPRQVINAITLYSVYTADLDPKAKDIGSSFTGFFKNIEILAQHNYQQAVVLSGMIFTLIIWVFAALSLLIAVFLYVFFLWHYIPNRDGNLSGYCERKINSRLTKIVSAKVNKALEEEERKKRKAEEKAIKKGEKSTRQTATVPNLENGDKLPEMPMLNRQDTMTTLPLYTSRPGTPSSGVPKMPDVELSSLDQKRPYPGRSITQSSGYSSASYSSNAPLIAGASDMGYGRSGSPAPSLPPLNTNNGYQNPQRTMTGSTNSSGWQQNNPQAMRMPSNGSAGPSRFAQGPYTQSPGQYGESQQRFNSPAQFGESQQRFNSPVQYGEPQQRFDSPAQFGESQQRFNSPVQYGESQQRFNSPVQFGESQQRFDSPVQYGEPQQRFNSPGPQHSLDNYGRNSPAPQQTMDGRPLPRQVTNLQGGRSTPGSMLSRQATLPDMNAAQPTLPNIEAAQPTLPNLESSRQTPATGDENGRSSPAPSMGRSSPAPQTVRNPSQPDMRSGSAPIQNSGGYVAFNPSMRSASAAPNPTQQQYPGNNVPRPPYRNMTAPASQTQQPGSYFGAPRVNTPHQSPPRTGTPQGTPPRVGTPQGQPPRTGTPNSMQNTSNDYRQPRVNDAVEPPQKVYQSYQPKVSDAAEPPQKVYQSYQPNNGSSSRPRPPPPDDRYQY